MTDQDVVDTVPEAPSAPGMHADIEIIQAKIEEESAFVSRLQDEVARVIVGQRYMVERLLIGLLADGHVLMEGVPGLAKTLTVSTLAKVIETSFQRIQFTPDLLPADLIGTLIYDPKSSEFQTKKGPHLRERHPGRRDQPLAGEGPGGAAGGDAGTPGHDRAEHVSAR